MPSQGEFPELIKGIFGDESINNFVSSVSCVASSRDKSKTENKEFIQGLEHFVDAMRGNTYTAVFLAEPVTQKEQNDIRAGYENLHFLLSVKVYGLTMRTKVRLLWKVSVMVCQDQLPRE